MANLKFYTDTLPKRESKNERLVPERYVTFDEGVAIARQLEAALVHPTLGPAGHVALGGGTLHRGYSHKDVDLIVYPRGQRTDLLGVLEAEATKLGWTRRATAGEMHDRWRLDAEGYAPVDDKHVEVWVTPDGVRVDLIVLGLPAPVVLPAVSRGVQF